jgi:RNA polymerase sigma-70 factor, ECF subfamily
VATAAGSTEWATAGRAAQGAFSEAPAHQPSSSATLAPRARGWRAVLRRPSGAPTDDDLIARVKGGDGEAFGLLYDRYVERVYAYVRVRVLDDALAEDLTHDVFVGALQGLSRFQYQGHVMPWLLRIAHNRLANHWRYRSRQPQTDPLWSADAADANGPSAGAGGTAARRAPEVALEDDPAECLLRRDDAEALDMALAALPDNERDVVALRFGLELSVDETARCLERTPDAVRSLQYRALRRLANRLRPEEPLR